VVTGQARLLKRLKASLAQSGLPSLAGLVDRVDHSASGCGKGQVWGWRAGVTQMDAKAFRTVHRNKESGAMRL